MNIGIIGYGNMGAAIAERLKIKYQIHVFDKDFRKTANCSGMTVAKDLEELSRLNTLFIAVKPQDYETLLDQIKQFAQMHLLISIAAGITTQYLESKLEKKAVVRAMPNLPVKVGAGMICLTRGKYATEVDVSFAKGLFNRLGKTLEIEERLMSAATAVSGSGPGFLYDILNNLPKADWDKCIQQEFIPALSQAAQQIGFTAEQAQLLAETTAQGSLQLLNESKVPAAILKVRVTSRGGTTEAGLTALQGKVENLHSAVFAAFKRSEELSAK